MPLTATLRVSTLKFGRLYVLYFWFTAAEVAAHDNMLPPPLSAQT
jgi:hypothetical protein